MVVDSSASGVDQAGPSNMSCQTDFTWLAPYEEKVFVQNFLPYSELGMVQNASTDLALRLVRDESQLSVGVYAVAPLQDVQVTLSADGAPFFETTLTLAPGKSWLTTLVDSGYARITMTVTRHDGQTLLQYEEHIADDLPLPSAATAPAQPEALSNTDELYFIGQHLEQYNHASRYAGDYYRRALEIDPQQLIVILA